MELREVIVPELEVKSAAESTCSAAGIEVGNSSACRCGETQCSTFKLNDNAIGKSCGCAD